MKTITIAGRLTRGAVLRTTNGGDQVLGFAVAVDDRSGKEKTALFFDCSLWGKRGEALAQYLIKGASVTASGDLGRREHEGKTYLTVRVNDVTLQGGRSDSQGEAQTRNPPSGSSASYDLNDDIPF